MRAVVGSIIAASAFVLGVAKLVVDWTGRTTFLEDAEALGVKLKPIADYLASQPALAIYGTSAALLAVGILVLFAARLGLLRSQEAPAPKSSTPPTATAAQGPTITTHGAALNILGSNNTTQNVHVGDVISMAPLPKLKVLNEKKRRGADGRWNMEIVVEVDSPYPPANLSLEARAVGISKIEVSPDRTGVSILGHTGIQPDRAFTNILHPSGRYTLSFSVPTADRVGMGYEFT